MPIIMLKNKRMSFPALAEPESVGDDKREEAKAYGCRLIIDPTDPDVKRLDAAMEAAAKERWKEDGPAILQMLIEDRKVAFEHRPYIQKKTGKPYGGFEGKYNLGTRTPVSKPKPTIFDKYGEPITDKSLIQSTLYSGCYVNAKVEIWAQDNSYGRRINCSLLGVMFAGDGDSFGGGAAPASADDFADLAQAPADPLGEDLV